jgi:hypothetical protein
VSAGNGTNGSGAGVSPRPEEVRADTEAALQQVLAAGEVAQGMWRFLLADRDRHRVEPPRVCWRPGYLAPVGTGVLRSW